MPLAVHGDGRRRTKNDSSGEGTVHVKDIARIRSALRAALPFVNLTWTSHIRKRAMHSRASIQRPFTELQAGYARRPDERRAACCT